MDILAILTVAPTLPWVIFAFIFMLLFRKPIWGALERLERVPTPWGDLALIKREIQKATLARPNIKPWHNVNKMEEQLKIAAHALHGATILWIDDNALNNARERKALRRAGAHVDVATTNAEAERFMNNERYDLIISDIKRENGDRSGKYFLKQLRDLNDLTPLIFYVGKVEGPPPQGSNGIVDTPVDLMCRVAEILTRLSA